MTRAARCAHLIRRHFEPERLLSQPIADAQSASRKLPVLPDCGEEVRSCRRFVWLIQSGPGDRSAFDDGGAASSTRGSALSVLARTTCAGEALIAVDRSVRRTRRTATGASAVLQRDRAAIGRSGAADSHADRWLLLRHPLGAAAGGGGGPQPGGSPVLGV